MKNALRAQAALWLALLVSCPVLLSHRAACQATAAASANDQWLAATKKLYYSSAKAGLTGFDCSAHADWRTLILSANNESALSADEEPKIALLNRVTITLHARMDGTAKLDWNQPPDPATPELAQMLDSIRAAGNQTLGGFVQFWVPFMDNSVIPEVSTGIEMSATADGGTKIHGVDNGTEVTEIFDKDRVLHEYDVKMPDTDVTFTPEYSSIDQGLVVSHFHALIRPKAGDRPVQELNVGVTYSNVDGIPIPSRLDMAVVGTSTFNFTLDNCSVTRK